MFWITWPTQPNLANIYLLLVVLVVDGSDLLLELGVCSLSLVLVELSFVAGLIDDAAATAAAAVDWWDVDAVVDALALAAAAAAAASWAFAIRCVVRTRLEIK